MTTKARTREEWLNNAILLLDPVFENLGAPLPAKIRVAIGFPSGGLRGKSVGECWDPSVSRDGCYEIFIRPDYEYPEPRENYDIQILATLVHELIHAALGLKEGHGTRFRRMAKTLSLEGKATATYAGESFSEFIKPIVEKIGTMPHALMLTDKDTSKSSRPKKQKARYLKCICAECGYTVRAVRKWLDIGAPHCPLHGEMGLEDS
ncbi:transcription elongation protein SprT [Budviciaceae bacterium BWR-B9]|uniref:Transcription elongation protein SprT n=1 Tax=Limnobaculum allomyrinae TaxID=2791986 RepID=A0ABS1IVU6_9GAMM|nr:MULTISPECIES: SprT-like domain-containing protein [Limnobaculum]MBK5145873.1 transcription elongation protein SprT [Limnobaculum allomyrinae]MBV7693884.1 SprT-like domain-containing protein [Limnobaculum sp. M2-1]